MPVTVNVRMKQRRKTAANWTSANEVLLDGEMGLEADTRKFKFGDGVTAWNSLSYATGLTLGTGVETALAVNVGSAGAFVTFNGAGGTPSSLTLTNATGLPTTGIVDDAVTYAKIQNVSATDKVLGRSTAGAGDVEEIAFTPVARTLAAQTTQALMRTTGLGLGTAAVKDTGTSGDAVPLLNGAATTWAAGSTWGSGGTGGGLTIVGLNATSNAGAGGFFSWQRDGTDRLWIGDKEAIIGSGAAAVYYAFSGAPHQFYVSGSFRFEVTTDGAAVTGNMFIANTSAPGTPTGGGVIYVESGALKYKGSSGTVTTLAVA